MSVDDDALAAAQRWLEQQDVPLPQPQVPEAWSPVVAAGLVVPVGLDAPAGPVAERGSVHSARAGAGGGAGDQPEDPVALARAVVLRKLAVRARTRHELDQALRARQVPDTVAHDVLDRLAEVGLVDDAAFARDWVDSRQQRRHLSKSALRHELQTKGVERELVDDALVRIDAQAEDQAAYALAERKDRAMSGLSREVRYRRLAGVLARRGFHGGVAARVLTRVLDEVTD